MRDCRIDVIRPPVPLGYRPGEESRIMELHLDPEEVTTLAAVLDRYLSDLRMEIIDTDNPDFKRQLKAERHVLEAVLARLTSAAT
jgi:hypothetical protein